jgi:hypothetical protein
MNFNVIFTFGCDCISNRKRIYEHYFGIISQYKIFYKLMSNICVNYCALVYDNTKFKSSINFEDKVKYYKAQPVNLELFKPVKLLDLERCVF